MGLVMTWYVPPFQKADEILHFENVAVLTQGGKGKIQSRFVNLPLKLKSREIAFKYERKVGDQQIWEKDQDKNLVYFNYQASLHNYISYFPVEVGVWLGSLSPYPALALYLGRFIGLVSFLICLWLSLRIIPKKYSKIIWAYAIIPMTIHQVTEVSYDVLLLCLTPLILAIFIKIIKSTKNFWKWTVLLSSLVLIFVLVKSGYYLMVVVVPIIFWRKYKDELIKRPWVVAIVGLLLIPIVIYFGRFLMNNVNSNSSDLINGSYQLEIIEHDPWQLVKIMDNTWKSKQVFYLKGVLGYFGWLDYELDLNQYLIVALVIISCLINTTVNLRKSILGWGGWLLMGLIIWGTYFLIEIGFLIQWTAVGLGMVEGVQGRYLLPLMPLVFFWITQFFLLLGKDRAKVFIFSVIMMVLVFSMVDKIFYRYNDLSDNFRNKDEVASQIREANQQKLEQNFLSSRKKLTINFHVSDGDILGGFEMATERHDNKITVPYRYSIKDKDCSRELSWGYLDSTKLNKENAYLQKIDQLKLGYRDICFEIEPIVNDNNQKYFDYIVIDDEPVVRLKFISSKVN